MNLSVSSKSLLNESTMELLREDMAAGSLEDRTVEAYVALAIQLGRDLYLTNPRRASDYLRFAADMLQANSPESRLG